MDVRAAAAALAEAVAARHPYPRWVATPGGRARPRAVAVLLGGPPVIGLTAFVVTAFIDRLGRVLGRYGVAPFFLQLVGALVATVVTLALLAVGALPPGTEPSLVIAAGITVLLSGLSVVGTVQDAISGYYVTAAGRAAEIALLSAGLLTGVILGLKLGLGFGLTLDPAEPLAADVAQFGISTFAAATAAAMFALACYAPLRALLAAGLAGGIGWAVYGALTSFAHFGPVVATGVAAAVFVGVATGWRGAARGVALARHHLVRDHPVAAGPHRLPRLLPAGRPGDVVDGLGDPHARAGHRPRARRGRGARRLRRPAPAAPGPVGEGRERGRAPGGRATSRGDEHGGDEQRGRQRLAEERDGAQRR